MLMGPVCLGFSVCLPVLLLRFFYRGLQESFFMFLPSFLVVSGSFEVSISQIFLNMDGVLGLKGAPWF